MILTAQEWMARTARVLPSLLSDAALWSDINAEVDAFFAAHPSEPRNQQSETVLRALIFQRLTSGQVEQPTQTERTANG